MSEVGLEQDKEFLEFATALNVSAGGMLVAVRRSLSAIGCRFRWRYRVRRWLLWRASPSRAHLRAKVLRIQHGEGYNLVGLKFSRPLVMRPANREGIPKEAIFSRCENIFLTDGCLVKPYPYPVDYYLTPPLIFSKLLFLKQID